MSELQISRDAAATTFTLNRPDKANALNSALMESLHAGLAAVEADGTRLLVLRGAGRNFCAGFDFGGFEETDVAELSWRFVRIEQLLQRLYHAAFDTVALARRAARSAPARDLLAACGERGVHAGLAPAHAGVEVRPGVGDTAPGGAYRG